MDGRGKLVRSSAQGEGSERISMSEGSDPLLVYLDFVDFSRLISVNACGNTRP